jgi:hypothetical protein
MRQARTAFAAGIVILAFCATAPGAPQDPARIAQIAPGGQPAAPGTGAPPSAPGAQRGTPTTSAPPGAPLPAPSPRPTQPPSTAQPSQAPSSPEPGQPGTTPQATPPPPSRSEQALPPGGFEQPSTAEPTPRRRRSARVRRYVALRAGIPRACRSVMFPRDPACGLYLPVTYGPYYYAPYPGYSPVYIFCSPRGPCR